jgi:hypothetical protein
MPEQHLDKTEFQMTQANSARIFETAKVATVWRVSMLGTSAVFGATGLAYTSKRQPQLHNPEDT